MKTLMFLLLLLLLPFTAPAQDIKPTPTPRPSRNPDRPTGERPVFPSTIQGQTTMSLGGTVTFRGQVMPKVEVTVINSNLGLRRTTTTDDMGRFLVNGLLPGWYEVRVTKAGFEVSRQDVELRIGQTVAFNVSLNQSAYTVDPGEIPVGTPASAGVSTAAGSTSTAAGFSGDVPVVPPSPNQPSATFEFITKNFDNDIELVSWLTTKKNEKKLLVRIFPIRDKTSLFMFQPIKGTTGYQFTASLVNEMLDENKLMTRINQNKGRTFIGVYLLSPQSYWMVFYGK